MKLQRIALLSVVGCGLAACSSDTGPTNSVIPPSASVRYINAMPDTNKTDFRFVDQVDGSPFFGQLYFRDISAYQVVAAGARHIRIFNVDPAIDAGTANEANIDIVSQTFVDTTITFEAGKYYTLVHVGYARVGSTPKQHLIVITDNRATAPTTTQIAVEAVNTAANLPSVDVYPNSTASGSPLFSSLAFGTSSGYSLLSTGSLTFGAAPSGSASIAASSVAPKGAPPASIAESALGGYSIGGSMLTAFVFPAAVTGSMAATLGPACSATGNPCSTAGVLWIQDNFPQMPGT